MKHCIIYLPLDKQSPAIYTKDKDASHAYQNVATYAWEEAQQEAEMLRSNRPNDWPWKIVVVPQRDAKVFFRILSLAD